ncbi:hypothetical protein N7492_007338 [Penicillium capsulatum]|uniref:Glycosyl transferase CAP10 domain-containing protein n=1 Tax=Penicillium capsulatum TaxID=69766 RepID=A0A9W9I243_9EURO|nr:hypothetical protein N7492_007338 [Penicillium capsulatum]
MCLLRPLPRPPRHVLQQSPRPTSPRWQFVVAFNRPRPGRVVPNPAPPEEAVAEYKRRYGRTPPKGFERWVTFALEHGSTIIDDFDQIERDLEPYRTPEAQRVVRLLGEDIYGWSGLVRIAIQNGTMIQSDSYIYDQQWKDLIQPFEHALPDTVLYLNQLDEPRVLASAGPPPSEVTFKDRSGDSITDLITESCSQLPRKSTGYWGPQKDICQSSNPEKLHGLISSPSSLLYTNSLAPILSIGKMSAFRDISIPCPCYLMHGISNSYSPPFMSKVPQVYWRGSTTGSHPSRFTWKHGHRERFISFTNSLRQAANILDAGQYLIRTPNTAEQKRLSLFKDVFDIKVGNYIQCEDDICLDMEQALGPTDREPEDTSMAYRFLYDIDGNSMSTRFYRLLSQKAVVLKQTWFQEWHDDRLIPWAHFIPVSMTMEELPDLLNYLINDPEGEKLSEQIAEAAYAQSHHTLRQVDMSIYLYRLFLEMAGLFGPKRSEDPKIVREETASEEITNNL